MWSAETRKQRTGQSSQQRIRIRYYPRLYENQLKAKESELLVVCQQACHEADKLRRHDIRRKQLTTNESRPNESGAKRWAAFSYCRIKWLRCVRSCALLRRDLSDALRDGTRRWHKDDNSFRLIHMYYSFPLPGGAASQALLAPVQVTPPGAARWVVPGWYYMYRYMCTTCTTRGDICCTKCVL